MFLHFILRFLMLRDPEFWISFNFRCWKGDWKAFVTVEIRFPHFPFILPPYSSFICKQSCSWLNFKRFPSTNYTKKIKILSFSSHFIGFLSKETNWLSDRKFEYIYPIYGTIQNSTNMPKHKRVCLKWSKNKKFGKKRISFMVQTNEVNY